MATIGTFAITVQGKRETVGPPDPLPWEQAIPSFDTAISMYRFCQQAGVKTDLWIALTHGEWARIDMPY